MHVFSAVEELDQKLTETKAKYKDNKIHTPKVALCSKREPAEKPSENYELSVITTSGRPMFSPPAKRNNMMVL